MTRTLIITDGIAQVDSQIACIKATFYDPNNNPLFPISASDDRGTFYGLDYRDIRPHLVEIIHSRPHVVRGNHVHAHCTETLSVLSGTLELFLLCNCPQRHLLRKQMDAGMTVQVSPGIAHAVYTLTDNEITAVFGDGDPREDRERVELIAI